MQKLWSVHLRARSGIRSIILVFGHTAFVTQAIFLRFGDREGYNSKSRLCICSLFVGMYML